MSSEMPPTPESPEHISGDPFYPEIRRARFQQLTIFEVQESELVILERGGPDSLFLNVSIALLTLALSLTASLVTATFTSDRAWTLFLVVAVVSYIVGFTLLVLWWRSRKAVAACIRDIRGRLGGGFEGTNLSLQDGSVGDGSV